ncbi:MAG: type IX secretion system sortase PorU [Bacteroidota bacterium]
MKRIMQTIFLTLTLLMAVAVTSRASEPDIRVIRSDERSIVIEYIPQYHPTSTVGENGQQFMLFDFHGAIPFYSHNTQAGFPDLRYRLLPLGFQNENDNLVQVVAADYEEIQNVSLAPLPVLEERDEMVGAGRYEQDMSIYRTGAFLPGPVSDLSPVSNVRSLLVGGVRVFPLQYNPVARTLRKYSRIQVEVVYGAAQRTRVQNEDDKPFNNFLLNYAVARNWKFGSPRSVNRMLAPSVLSTGEWYRLTVQDEGVYRLDASYLASLGINVSAIDPRTIKIYGNGGTLVPENITLSRADDLVENAIHVEGESDGQFGGSDFVLFFGKSTRGWNYSPAQRSFNHYINYYSEVNYYWLTFGGATGKRMQTEQSLADNPTVVPDRFTDLVQIEEEKVNFFGSGKEWYGQALNPGGAFTFVATLHGLLAGELVRYRTVVASRSTAFSTLTLRENGDSIGVVSIVPTSGFQYANEGTIDVRVPATLPGNTSQLNLQYRTTSVSGSGWINWIEIHYPRRFEAVANYLRFRSPDTSGIVEYRLAGFASLPWLFDVTQPSDVRSISGAVGSYTIRTQESAGQISEYCAVGSGGFKTPLSAARIPNQSLRGITDGADFIIVTSREFRSAANRLAAHREQPAFGNLRTLVVEVDTIYNEFGGGLPDITAIRDFLKYAYNNWIRRPEFVLFFGGGSYDYKGISGSKSNYVPTWQSGQSLNDINSFSTDDFYAKFGPTDAISLTLGRISSRSLAEANIVVDKLIKYDAESSTDGWSSRMLFIGDDSWTPEQEDGLIHSRDAELLAENFTPDEFEKRKIYIAEYPTVNTAQGRRKPGAYQAIIDEINRGVLVVNFAGHGNPTVWAHESIFNVQTSIPQLVNPNKLSVFYAATCNFSQFDDLKRYTGSEILMNKSDGGAIGVVSATRKVFAGANAYFHQNNFNRMFSRDQFGRLLVDRPARAMFLVKTIANSVNDQKFFFMGDPTMRLKFPAGYASIDSINYEPVDSVDGGPRLTPIQLRALSKVSVKGSIRNVNNVPEDSFNGTMTLTLNDATRNVTILVPMPGPVPWTYVATGGTIFRGQNSVANGRFNATFIIPKDILYADTSSRGRMVAYYTGAGGDGLGYTSRIYLGGTDSTATADATGPEMEIFLNGRSFRSGDMVGEEPTLIVDLTDSSGINTSGSGIGHRIEAWLNNSAESQDLTEFYTSTIDNYQEGTVQYQLRGLSQGRNTVRIRSWDTYNNSSTAEAFFDIASTDQLRVTEIMNYPNPFANGTAFTFKQNLLEPLSIVVKIYTTAGRLIQSIETVSPGEPFVQLPWDGRDRDGDVLANGVYLYKLVVKTTDGRFTSESLGKLAVVK